MGSKRMNERIADILEQAFDHCKKYDDEGKTGLVKTTEAFHVFAELIVRECIDILMKPEYVMTHPEGLTRYNEGWVNGRLLGIEHIKEHFGVES
jgi:hypothetical protein